MNILEQSYLHNNHMEIYGRRTLLHHAIIVNDDVSIVQKLITGGADINACDPNTWTPLHYAVYYNKLEYISMLLYYGADVRVESKMGSTPLTLAFKARNVEIMKILLSYYYEFANIDLTNIVFYYTFEINDWEDVLLITLTIHNGYIEPFKLIWPRIDQVRLAELPPSDPLVLEYVRYCSTFSPSDWLDGLLLILDSPRLRHLFNDPEIFVDEVIYQINEPEFDYNQRKSLFYKILSTGIDIKLFHLEQMYINCGFNQELVEAFVYAGYVDWVETEYNNSYTLFYFILSFKVDFNSQNVYEIFCKELEDTDDPDDLFPWFKYFSLPSHLKTELVNNSGVDETTQKIILDELTEFPSLVELSRLAVHKLIKQTRKIRKPYQFYDAIKKLCIPQELKDILLMKKRIYI